MSDLEKTAREHDQEGSSEDREAQNDTRLETGLSGQKPIPSAPPFLDNTRNSGFPGENCDTTLLHTVNSGPSDKRGHARFSGLRACHTDLHHKPSSRSPGPSERSRPNGASRTPGLILRGTTFYLRLRVPRHLSSVIGRTHFMRSLSTRSRSEASRLARLVAGDFERTLREIEADLDSCEELELQFLMEMSEA